MIAEQHLFRLLSRGKPARACRFNSDRYGFREALADALIDIRLRDRMAPIALQIASPMPAVLSKDKKGAIYWIGLPDGLFFEGHLPSVIRWESASDLCDHLVAARAERMAVLAPARSTETVRGH